MFSACKVYSKKLWAQFHDLCVQKQSCLLWNSDAFSKFSACGFYRKSSGRNSTICTSKNKAVCYEIETHSGISLPIRFTGLWVQFHDLCAQKRSCLPWNSDAFSKFSACKFYRKCSWRNFTICASKNKAVFCEVQMRFGSSLPLRSTEKVVGTIPQFFRPRSKLFAVKFRCIYQSSLPVSFTKKLWAQFHNFYVKKRSCLLWNSDAFWSSRFAGFMKNIQGALSRFVRPKIKLFTMMFRHISEVFRLQCLQGKFWTNFHDWCVHKRSCLLWSSDAFCKFPLASLIKKLWAHFHNLCVV